MPAKPKAGGPSMIEPPGPSRFARRILCNHIPVLTVSAILLFVFYLFTESPNPVYRGSIATAYTGLVLLAATLLTGPVNVLLNRPNPLSSDLRRDIGIWAGVVGIAHAVIGINVHFAGQFLKYFLAETNGRLTIRTNLFGFANHTGLAATVLLVVLLITSNDYSMRLLGPKRWKIIQSANYALFLLVAAHTVCYYIIEKRAITYIVIGAVVTLATLAFQVAALFKRCRNKSQRLDLPESRDTSQESQLQAQAGGNN